MAQQNLKQLSKPCTKVLAAHGQRVLKSLTKQDLPFPLKHWPDIAPAAARASLGDPVPLAPLDPAVFQEPPPSDFDEGAWSLEEQDAFSNITAHLFDLEADNLAQYHS